MHMGNVFHTHDMFLQASITIFPTKFIVKNLQKFIVNNFQKLLKFSKSLLLSFSKSSLLNVSKIALFLSLTKQVLNLPGGAGYPDKMTASKIY